MLSQTDMWTTCNTPGSHWALLGAAFHPLTRFKKLDFLVMPSWILFSLATMCICVCMGSCVCTCVCAYVLKPSLLQPLVSRQPYLLGWHTGFYWSLTQSLELRLALAP